MLARVSSTSQSFRLCAHMGTCGAGSSMSACCAVSAESKGHAASGLQHQACGVAEIEPLQRCNSAVSAAGVAAQLLLAQRGKKAVPAGRGSAFRQQRRQQRASDPPPWPARSATSRRTAQGGDASCGLSMRQSQWQGKGPKAEQEACTIKAVSLPFGVTLNLLGPLGRSSGTVK